MSRTHVLGKLIRAKGGGGNYSRVPMYIHHRCAVAFDNSNLSGAIVVKTNDATNTSWIMISMHVRECTMGIMRLIKFSLILRYLFPPQSKVCKEQTAVASKRVALFLRVRDNERRANRIYTATKELRYLGNVIQHHTFLLEDSACDTGCFA